ncbi:MAG: FAD-dependent oxidoreductase [Chloroflexi bacterium]|nr:FAD-dependent oxidoreductase [Chloroflexota bacterium]MDA1271006.1 FAD-dependent oxidoreductase [Chloroflexota bacterium]
MAVPQSNIQSTVVVVGGGVVGCFTAYRLASMGAAVTLLEMGGPGSGATGNSAGNVQPASGDDDAYRIALGAESLALWRKHLPQIKEWGGVDYQEQDVRYLYAATNDPEEIDVRRILDDLRSAGLKAEWVDGETAREIEPRLSPSITGGTLHQDCIQMEPKLFMTALSRAASAAGANVVGGTQVVGLDIAAGQAKGVILQDGTTLECSSVILATGAWTSKLMSDWLGLELPVEPYGLQKLHLNLGTPPPLHCAVRWDGVNIVSRKDGLVHAGSSFDPAGFDTKPSLQAQEWLLERVAAIMPGLEPSGVENIAAFAASTPDRIPLVGPAPGVDGVFLNVPSTDGFLMSAALAEMTTQLLMNGERHPLMDRSPLARVDAG